MSTAPTAPCWADRDSRPNVLLLGAGDRPNVAENIESMTAIVSELAQIAVSDFQLQTPISQTGADFAVVLGGDGSILRAAKQMGAEQLPVLGVNLGRLGYLAAISPEELTQVLPAVCQGCCRIIEHLMFRCQILRGEAVLYEVIGLNEMAILAGPPYSMLDVDLYVDAELATTYSCDGLIISTPIGSTAHSLSAGGPILRKNLQAFVILPISPHTLTVRPVVDSADRIYEAAVKRPHNDTSVVVDGRVVCRLTAEDRVRVEQAPCRFKLIETESQHYYRTLREKLGWGGMIRRRADK